MDRTRYQLSELPLKQEHFHIDDDFSLKSVKTSLNKINKIDKILSRVNAALEKKQQPAIGTQSENLIVQRAPLANFDNQFSYESQASANQENE